jgi:CheY-like chemotaxis protein
MRSRALIVDDELAESDLIKSVLGAAGIDALSLSTGTAAAVHLRDEKFAVAVFDLRMPAPNGIDLARQMRASGINLMTPIILVSDDQSNSAVSQGFAAGASLFLYKPIDKSRLLKLIRVTQGAIEHERRRFRRIAIRSKVLLGFEKSEWECETIDISLNGMLVQSATCAPKGSSVRVNLYLSGEMKPIVGLGFVVRLLGGNRMGIQLNRLAMAESGRLQNFLLPLILQGESESTPVSS